MSSKVQILCRNVVNIIKSTNCVKINLLQINRHFCTKMDVDSLQTGTINCNIPRNEYLTIKDGRLIVDKSKFNEKVQVPYVEVNKKVANSLLLYLKPFLFKGIKINPVCGSNRLLNHSSHQTVSNGSSKNDNDTKIDGDDQKEEVDKDKIEVALNPDKIKTIDDFNDEVRDKFKRHNTDLVVKYKSLSLKYENFSSEQIFKKILPFDGTENLSSFSTIGHIIHLNLRDHLLPYKYIIGQVLLDKHSPRIRLVVNKLNEINSEFRFFKMETIAKAEDDAIDTIVTVKHAKCDFQFDFSSVYWNPRLDTEHSRIIDKLRHQQDVLYDVFAGVGPFSVPIGKKKKCQVLANDLNPECVKWMKLNVQRNKVEKYVQIFNLDGREFIKTQLKPHLFNEWKQFNDGHEIYHKNFHVTMNLPAIAIQFLDSFVKLFDEEESRVIREFKSDIQLPVIHLYTFLKKEKDENVMKEQLIRNVNQVINYELTNEMIHEIRMVRNVAPSKEMYRISFTLPKDVILSCEEENVPKEKKLKVK